MSRAPALALLSGLALFAAADGSGQAPADAARVRHALIVTLEPGRGWLSVSDTLSVPASAVTSGEAEFLLHGALRIVASEPPVREAPRGDAARFFGINATAPDLYAAGQLKRYRVALPAGGGAVRLQYEGRFDFGLSDPKEEYTRGFRQTIGIVSPQGVYLAGNGFWYPHTGRGLVEFSLEARAPEGFHLVSQGNGVSRGGDGVARWESAGPMDEIYLVGGPLQLYREGAGAVEAQVYLRERDDALAGKYLSATAQYLEMYRSLVGPYPYRKFALVENFWETGYGMPSFTLLGPQIIRFPFIIASSYPHEILHNWWGNSVFVDYETGNWCEGLTAYMADHLIQEQRGKGEEYRRDTLQKYRNYVRDGRDFPLTEFRSRHSAATEAVGYGKTLMGFHMLRRRLGDEAFRRWAAAFYREKRGTKASFSDVRRTMEGVSGEDLGRFFTDWVERPGAAALEVRAEAASLPGGGYEVRGVLRQTQGGEPFAVDVPLVVRTSGPPVVETLRARQPETPFTLRAAERPLALDVDPGFDVFRRLDPREIPASIGQIFGEPRILAVLPSDAPAAETEAYRALVLGWRSESHDPQIATDAEIAELPEARAVWLLGRKNRLAAKAFAALPGLTLGERELAAGGETMPLPGHSAVLVRRHPGNAEKAVGWIFAEPLAALPGLGRKLPHYGKYSYLGFEGQEPVNVLKGQWTASDSPLHVELRPPAERATALAALAPPPRKALAELPPVFSEKTLLEQVAFLAAPEREGRGVGTVGLEEAARYVAARFQAIGLAPGGDAGGYLQAFAAGRTPDGRPATLRNVIGVLRGTKPEWEGQSVVVSAHYDHLGRGWPDVRRGHEGELHPGADDNASGVSVMLELARAFAAGERPLRTIVFVAFSGEESGRQGSRHYVEQPPFPFEKLMGVLNLDTVGRLGSQKLSLLAAGTATEWPHIFRGASFVTGVESRSIADQSEASDQRSFIERGVPAVQVFTEAHEDYHRPSDIADRIDGPGLVKVATFVKECVGYLAERKEPLTVTIARAAAAPSAGAPPAGRRASLGTVPDFAFAGPGVRAESVVPGSPAEKAGLQAGDVLVRLDGKPIESLRGYSDLLKTLAPGQTVALVVHRGGREESLSVTLGER